MNCAVCNSPLSGLYQIDDFGYKAHNYHDTCDSCTGFIIGPSHLLSDGRKTCHHCYTNSVKDKISARLAKEETLRLFSIIGINFPLHSINIFVNDKLYAAQELNSPLFLGKLFTVTKGLHNSYTIHVLYGLHKVIFISVLAHELMHVWQYENDIELSDIENEGLCELVCYFVLDASRTKIGKVIMKRMEESKDPVYGDGFRLMYNRLEKVGNWNAFLKGLK